VKDNKLRFFTASWCGACPLAKKRLAAAATKLGVELDVDAISTSLDTKEGTTVANSYKIRALPALVVLTSKGKVVDIKHGALSTKTYMEVLSEVFNVPLPEETLPEDVIIPTGT